MKKMPKYYLQNKNKITKMIRIKINAYIIHRMKYHRRQLCFSPS